MAPAPAQQPAAPACPRPSPPPDDVWSLVLTYLDRRDLGAVSQLSRRFRTLCTSEALFRAHVARARPLLAREACRDARVPWRARLRNLRATAVQRAPALVGGFCVGDGAGVVRLCSFPADGLVVFYRGRGDCVVGWPGGWERRREEVCGVRGVALQGAVCSLAGAEVAFLENGDGAGGAVPRATVVCARTGVTLRRVVLETEGDGLVAWPREAAGGVVCCPFGLRGGRRGDMVVVLTGGGDVRFIRAASGECVAVWRGLEPPFGCLVRSACPASDQGYSVDCVVLSEEVWSVRKKNFPVPKERGRVCATFDGGVQATGVPEDDDPDGQDALRSRYWVVDVESGAVVLPVPPRILDDDSRLIDVALSWDRDVQSDEEIGNVVTAAYRTFGPDTDVPGVAPQAIILHVVDSRPVLGKSHVVASLRPDYDPVDPSAAADLVAVDEAVVALRHVQSRRFQERVHVMSRSGAEGSLKLRSLQFERVRTQRYFSSHMVGQRLLACTANGAMSTFNHDLSACLGTQVVEVDGNVVDFFVLHEHVAIVVVGQTENNVRMFHFDKFCHGVPFPQCCGYTE